MRPAQIRVFDGLRITTDHVNHLQGAVASGFEDFRAILGVSRPQTGLEVTIAEDGTATVQPGTAFDQQKNRLACDDPLTVKVSFGPDDKAKFICLKYEQVEDNPVEGHPTMIWDSCSALVRDGLPDARENLVVLARVVKDQTGSFSVESAQERCNCVHQKTPDLGVAPDPVASATPASIPTSNDGKTNSSPELPSDSGGGSTDTQPTAPPGGSAPTGTPATPAVRASSAAAPPSAVISGLKFKQGIIQLSSDANTSPYFRTVVAPGLRAKLGAKPFDLTFSLGQMEVSPELVAGSFASHGVLSGSLMLGGTGTGTPAQFSFECVSHGEATPSGAVLAQFAASSLTLHVIPTQSGATWASSDFTARGLAEFAFSKWSSAPEGVRPPLPAEVLAGLSLVAQLAPAAQGFTFALRLLWSGTVSEESVKALESLDVAFGWQVLMGWKAAGN